MRKYAVLGILSLAGAAVTGCTGRADTSKGAIAETYIHKYGLPIDKDDWEGRGQNGKIVTNRKDGVCVTRSFAGGQLHGQTTYSFPHSDVISKVEQYDHGSLLSEQENYASGNPMVERKIFLGDEILETNWYGNGTPRARETTRANLLVAAEYFTTQNELEGRVEGGEGKRIVRDAEGNLLSEDAISKGLMVRRTTFFGNGDPESVTSYTRGQEHGEKRTYLPGGIPSSIENWAHGELHGLKTVFANGEKKAEIPYENGRKHGTERRFGSDGSVVEEITWLRDIRHGSDQFFVEGEHKTDWYHHGQLVSKAIFERLNPQP